MEYIKQLEDEIRQRNLDYRNGTPTISDAKYDELVSTLKEKDPNNKWFDQIEPAAVSKTRKAKLPIPMKSLNKVKSMADIQQWAKGLALPANTKLVIMPKYDGVSWLHDEINHKTYSRGGAENEGQECNQHFKVGGFKEISDANSFPAHFTFGELVFSRKDWETSMAGRKSDSTGEPYKSPRNTVAGFINRDEATKDIKYATFMRYGVDEASLNNWESFADVLKDMTDEFDQWLYNGDLKDLPFYQITLKDLTENLCISLFFSWEKHYYIDGVVIYIDDLSLWKSIGRQQTTGNPLYAIAYKHPDFTESFETTVQNIIWKTSKSGALKPVVNIDAVDTGDCTMENPTGYNAKFIFENGIGEGAKITVTRSGGVIPKIISIQQEATSEIMMDLRDSLLYCPDCKQPTKWNDSKVELVCTNPDCPGIRFAKIVHFYTTLESEQMGEETIAKMFKAGYNTLQRILDITFDELMLIDGFGESIANIIIDTNKKIRDGVEIVKLMHASDCFQGIGQVKAKSIVSNLSESDRFAFTNGYVFVEDGFQSTKQFASLNKTMQSFYKGIEPFYDFVARNKLKIQPMQKEAKPIGNKYTGMKVCFSGIRDKSLEQKIAEQGGTVVSGVSKNTTHLIVADVNSSSSKTEKAKALNIPIFTIQSFEDL